jgi:hypothetical protein
VGSLTKLVQIDFAPLNAGAAERLARNRLWFTRPAGEDLRISLFGLADLLVQFSATILSGHVAAPSPNGNEAPP